MGRYRIENIQKARVGSRDVKLFNAYEYDSASNAYIHIGQFDAPASTPNERLIGYIEDEE